MPQDQWRYSTDVREIEVGKWETRKGNDFFSIPIGEAVNVEQTSITGAASYSFSTTAYFAAKVIATSSGRLSALEANIRNTASGTGTVVLALYSDSSSSPGTELARTTIAASTITSSYQYLKGRLISCPNIVNGTTYWVVGFVQSGGSNSYQISTTTNASTGKTSANGGQTWSSQSYAFNVKLSTATSGGIKGTIRVKRPNGTYYTFFAHGTNLYSVNEGTGVTTSVDSGLNTNATYCRFEFVNDTLFYVTGLQKPRKYNFTAASEVSAAPENAAAIIKHKGLVFFLSADDVTKMFFTNFALYETFTSTDFVYVDAPKTSDPAVGFAKLNGNLFISTRKNKFILYGSENATFRLDEAPGQKGTFTQESMVYDQNYIYLASDDGIYQYNGAEEKNIAKDILNRWTELTNKSNTVLELFNNRLYVWYTPNGQSENTKCFVYNTLYGIWESEDTNTYISRAYSRFEVDDKFIQASNRVGMVMYAEQSTNDYSNMGEPLTWELRTHYNHYETPAQFKRAPTYRPHFDAQTGNYSVQVGYATDYNDSPTFADIALQGSGPTFNSGYTFNSGVQFGGSQQINPMDSGVNIPGEWRRLQLRYKHYAAREPVTFDGYVMTVETQRLI
ncbi:MAG TPA: hypothetical protein VJ836_00790 [Candidatus Saccharimonadales bacterium]|nr:hypothetical protein [Candidatus Saccharimonadales bacterium]